ncbi:MAG TPA: vWA domain-containing protein [Solirubrobacterales bacterium]|nr:vWA domain-containing protein [Solirubrobacterales bacterium]
MGFSAIKRFALLVVLVLGLAVPAAAQAAPPAHTDVLFVFDTTGSMGSTLTAAKSEIQEAMAQIATSVPDPQFGLAEVNDYKEVINGAPFVYGEGGGFQPWTLKVPITPQQATVASELLKLNASGGGDSPEAYGRGLFESDTNPAVGWRPDARGVIVLVADDVPHDNNVNEGIPAAFQLNGSVWNTGVDPGPDNTVGTADDIDWLPMLQRLVTDGKPLEFVAYQGTTYLQYWEQWTALTGGSAISAGGIGFGSKLAALVKAGASAALPPCPVGQLRDPGDRCVSPPSNNFKIEPRISCAKGCYVVNVKIVFDSAGNVISESVLDEEPASSSSVAAVSVKKKPKKHSCGKTKKGAKAAKKGKCKKPALIKAATQAVVAGPNVISLSLTGAAIKALNEKGKLPLKVRFTYTPTGTGGTANSLIKTFTVKKPIKKIGKKTGKGSTK